VKRLGTGTVKDHDDFNEVWQELEVRKESLSTNRRNGSIRCMMSSPIDRQ
jgi:hypothetical protein